MQGDQYKDTIRPFLDDNRYYHSLCVAQEALRLAKKYNADEEKAYTAGMLHDITKQMPIDKQLQILEKSSIIKVDSVQGIKKIYHSKSGAAYIHDTLGITDEEIITAISYHTTARPEMTLMEKILYIADFTSADRDYSDVSVMRILCNESMSEAMKYALSYTVSDLVALRKRIHTDTLAAYNYYVEK